MKLMIKAAALGLAMTLALWSSAGAQVPPKGLGTWGLRGKVGAYPIGMQLTVRGGRDVVSGHYFYVRTLIDIPLASRMEGGALILQEPERLVRKVDWVAKQSLNENYRQRHPLARPWFSAIEPVG